MIFQAVKAVAFLLGSLWFSPNPASKSEYSGHGINDPSIF
jgi:hypothetical protein